MIISLPTNESRRIHLLLAAATLVTFILPWYAYPEVPQSGSKILWRYVFGWEAPIRFLLASLVLAGLLTTALESSFGKKAPFAHITLFIVTVGISLASHYSPFPVSGTFMAMSWGFWAYFILALGFHVSSFLVPAPSETR